MAQEIGRFDWTPGHPKVQPVGDRSPPFHPATGTILAALMLAWFLPALSWALPVLVGALLLAGLWTHVALRVRRTRGT